MSTADRHLNDRNYNEPHGRCFGLALQRSFAEQDEYDEEEAWGSLWNPCGNCQELIRLLNGERENFLRDFG